MNEKLYDVIVIGGGPAGLTAAIYLARARYRVLVMEKEKYGGQIRITSEVVNYPGIGIGSGEEITTAMRKQAQSFGAEFMLAEVENVELEGEEKIVKTLQGDYKAFGIIIATGAQPRTIGFQGEAEYKGRGVAYCATCDGEFFTGLDVFVVGGGFAAAEEAVFLTKYARHVYVLVRGDDFTAAKAATEPVKNHENITIYYNTEVESVSGNNGLNLLKMKNSKTGEITEYRPPDGETFGLFVFAGYKPETDIFKGKINLNDSGYVITDNNGKTNIEGVYAAGDLRQKGLRQVVTATSDGAVAATELERYIAFMQEKTGKIPKQPTTRIKREKKEDESITKEEDVFFSEEIKSQLNDLFGRMKSSLILKAVLDDRPVSRELKGFLEELTKLTDKISLELEKDSDAGTRPPCVRIFNHEGEDTGIAFHGIPGGHEFNPFVIGLYNVAGPGQTLGDDIIEKVASFKEPVDMKILVALSCELCPDLVMAAQQIAVKNPNVRAEAYDLNYFPDLKEQYKVMSVPCLVINDKDVTFGKKNIRQLINYLNDINV